jgi:hypothetical protein
MMSVRTTGISRATGIHGVAVMDIKGEVTG